MITLLVNRRTGVATTYATSSSAVRGLRRLFRRRPGRARTHDVRLVDGRLWAWVEQYPAPAMARVKTVGRKYS